MKRILFIGHDASRTGAPIVLLQLLRWIKNDDPSLSIDLLLLQGGELEADYAAVANVFVMPRHESDSLVDRAAKRIKRKLGVQSGMPTAKIRPFTDGYDVVFGNTIASVDYLQLFKGKGFRTVLWLHELDYVLSRFVSRERFVELAKSVDHFVVASRAVDLMLKRMGIHDRSTVVYEFSEVQEASYDANAVRSELGLSNDAFIVCGGGSAEWRKGTDLFLQIALRVSKIEPAIHFVWIGGEPKPATDEWTRIKYDLDRLELEKAVTFTGITRDPHRYLSTAAIFALTSREDPFPLFCLEAAALEKPVICFADAGGMPEFVENNAGAIVPYGDIDAYSEKILYFRNNEETRERAGRAAREKLRSRFAAEESSKRIKEILIAR